MTSSQLEIKDAKKDDLPHILEIVNREIKESPGIYIYDPQPMSYIENLFREKKEKELPLLVATLNSTVIGYGTYNQFRPRDGYRFTLEHSIYLHQDHRGNGAGTQLMHAIIDRGRAQGYHTMIAGIDEENKGSYRFHEKFGFVEVARFKEVGYKFGTWRNLVFMQLML